MTPTLRAGDTVLIDPLVQVAENDVVVVRHPSTPELRIIKRVEFVDEFGRLFLRSDNDAASDSVDSRVFGAVDSALVVGVVTSRIPTPRGR